MAWASDPPTATTFFPSAVNLSQIARVSGIGPRAILDNPYKLVIEGERAGGIELFDMQNDPGEKKDLREVKPAIARELEQRLRAWQESVLNSLQGTDY